MFTHMRVWRLYGFVQALVLIGLAQQRTKYARNPHLPRMELALIQGAQTNRNHAHE